MASPRWRCCSVPVVWRWASRWPTRSSVWSITVAILAVLRTAVRDVFRRLMDGVDPTFVDAAEAALAAETRRRCGAQRARCAGSGTACTPTPNSTSTPRPSLRGRAPHRPRRRTRPDSRRAQADHRDDPCLSRRRHQRGPGTSREHRISHSSPLSQPIAVRLAQQGFCSASGEREYSDSDGCRLVE